jgi:predicted RNase H-like nuclease
MQMSRRIDGRGLHQQAYLLPKIMEVDRNLREDRARQWRVIEIHPEVSFAAWNGGKLKVHTRKRLMSVADAHAAPSGKPVTDRSRATLVRSGR